MGQDFLTSNSSNHDGAGIHSICYSHFHIPPTHPRAQSLFTRNMLVDAYRRGLVVSEGLIAHGRGEAFDYLLGEKTTGAAQAAIEAATSALMLSRYPIISVNGNLAALCAKTVVELSYLIGAKIEVNLFYRTLRRERLIRKELKSFGAKEVLGTNSHTKASIPKLQSERRRVAPNGIMKADTVLVTLEDGDRTEALAKMGKTVVAIDLNPMSRTARSANITIVDNVIRAIPKMIMTVKKFNDLELQQRKIVMKKMVKEFNNNRNLVESLSIMQGNIA
ncbi:MAG TPA: phosphopantothenate/pantothenate synthetase [Nitrososphaeraceae archaeon]|nr:phosphopantothenate/pantothenate synthetase [Nitrososphaeraceae archaeon]